MTRWPTRPLGEVARVTAGDPAPQAPGDFSPQGVPFVRMQDVGRYGQTSNLAETKDRLSAAASARFKRFPVGSVLVPKSGASIRLNHRAILGIEAHVVSHLAVIVPRPPLLSRFVYYWLCGIDLSRVAHEADLPSMKTSDLAKLEIPFPAQEHQQRIVRLLDDADALRQMRAEADARTEKLIPALFAEMFGDPQTNPRGWPLRQLDHVVDFVGGGTPSRAAPEFWKGQTPWVSPKDMKPDEITDTEEHIGKAAFSATNLQLIPADTVLIVVRGMILAHTVPIRVCRVPVAINQDMKALLPRQPMSSEFLRWALQAKHGHLLQRISTAGHGTKKLDTDRLRELSLAIPPMAMQEELSRRVSDVRAVVDAQAKSRDQLEALFQSTLQRAFAGEI